MKRAIFLDRDGVINEERGYITDWADFILLPRVVEALALVNPSDFLLVVVTNQSGIAKGLYTEKEVNDIHHKLQSLLKKFHVKIDAFYYCPHHPDGKNEYAISCDCRKPEDGMLRKAAKELHIDVEKSFMIGDSTRDILAGKKSGCTTIGVKTGHGFEPDKILPDYLVEDFFEAVQLILSLSDT